MFNIPNVIKNISPTELLIIALILVVVFGSKAVARLGRTGGETLREINKIKNSFTDAIEDDQPHKNKKGVS